jgi:hypothetical protein
MKLAVQYLNDAEGKTQAVQIPITEWKKLLERVKKYEQSLKIKSDLKEALEEVAVLRKSSKKKSLSQFLNEL